MANTLSSMGGFLSSYMVGTLTYENVSNSQNTSNSIICVKNIMNV